MKIQPRYIISDLLEDIFKRLPFKSLMRFKCVSRSFGALIKNPRFELKQLSHYKQTNKDSINILLKYNNLASSQTRLVHLSDGAGRDRSLSVTEVDLPQKTCSSPYPYEFSLVGHCNGILCLCCPSNRCLCGSVILYNPTIGESKVVPRSSSSNYDESQYSRRVKFGFGHDLKTNDLLVIMVSTFLLLKAEDFPGKIKHYTSFEEYSLRTNSWREMKKYSELFFINRFWVYHKGVYYWTSDYSFSSRKEIIVRFECQRETLRLVPMPSNEELSSHTQTCLGVVHDSLALVCSNNAKSHFSVWVMNSSTGKDLWTMITRTSYRIPHGVWPFLVTLKGYEILVGITTEQFIVYDLSTKQMKKLVPNSSIAPGRGGPLGGLHAVNYVESIISVRRN
ncbi:hypothetical protein L6164_006796 [Bauhinia variegata]|uniref:Uncharacterized protein n=1 Tax=Bauhinia variegata TaxID=167791 RepID=A0ACB9PUS2_BAUVA|nr:hypothetical protein L6164_006796 [Bauhinia variegata]